MKRPKKGSSSKKTILALIRTESGLSESEFGLVVGLTKYVVHEVSLGRRKFHDAYWPLLELGVGAKKGVKGLPENSGTRTQYTRKFFTEWRKFSRELGKDLHSEELIRSAFYNVALFIEAAQSKGRLFIALHLLEESLRQVVGRVDLESELRLEEKKSASRCTLFHKERILTKTRHLAAVHFKKGS